MWADLLDQNDLLIHLNGFQHLLDYVISKLILHHSYKGNYPDKSQMKSKITHPDASE
jgi:hypothetical protein